MKIFQIVVVPTDFSEHSMIALEYAVAIAEKFSCSLRIIHVIEPVLQPADLSWATVDY